jgi:predicted Zn-dependent protease
VKYVPKEIPEGINVPPDHPLRDFLILIGSLIGVLAVTYMLLGWGVDWAVMRISTETETKLGNLLLPNFISRSKGLSENPKVQEIVDALGREAGKPKGSFHASVVCIPEVNAFAVPGGSIVVWNGLLSQAKTENELAMVIGHELGHFAHRDHLRRLGRGLVIVTMLSAVGIDADGGISKMLLGNTSGILSNQFSQAQEMSADEYGAELVYKKYGTAAGMTDFFERMTDREASPPLEKWISTHPPSSARVVALKALIKRKGWKEGKSIPLAKTFSARCGELEKEAATPPAQR